MKPNPKLLGKKLEKGHTLSLDDTLSSLDISKYDRKEFIKGWVINPHQYNKDILESYIKVAIEIGDKKLAIRLADKAFIDGFLDNVDKIYENLDENYKQRLLKLTEKLLTNGAIASAIACYNDLKIDYTKSEIKDKILAIAKQLYKRNPFNRNIFTAYRLFDHDKYLDILELMIDDAKKVDDTLIHVEAGQFFHYHEFFKNHPKFESTLEKIIGYCTENMNCNNLNLALKYKVPGVTREMVLKTVNVGILDSNLNAITRFIELENPSSTELLRLGNVFFDKIRKKPCEELNHGGKITDKLLTPLYAYFYAADTKKMLEYFNYLKRRASKEKNINFKKELILTAYEAAREIREFDKNLLTEKDLYDLSLIQLESIGESDLLTLRSKNLLSNLKQKFESEGNILIAELVQKRIEIIDKINNGDIKPDIHLSNLVKKLKEKRRLEKLEENETKS